MEKEFKNSVELLQYIQNLLKINKKVWQLDSDVVLLKKRDVNTMPISFAMKKLSDKAKQV